MAMSRLTQKRYEQRVMLAMLVYMAVLIGEAPLLRMVASLPLKALLAVAPVAPMLYVIALMWWRIRDSDELEQRAHLVALGMATALLSALSMVGGFLAAGGVLHLNGSVLIWVFPVLMAGYGLAYKRVARHYGMGELCTDAGSPWLPWYFGFTGVLMAVLGVYAWRWLQRPWDALVLGAGAALFAVLAVRLQRRRARALRQDGKR
jgi:hypothetical protein